MPNILSTVHCVTYSMWGTIQIRYSALELLQDTAVSSSRHWNLLLLSLLNDRSLLFSEPT